MYFRKNVGMLELTRQVLDFVDEISSNLFFKTLESSNLFSELTPKRRNLASKTEKPPEGGLELVSIKVTRCYKTTAGSTVMKPLNETVEICEVEFVPTTRYA